MRGIIRMKLDTIASEKIGEYYHNFGARTVMPRPPLCNKRRLCADTHVSRARSPSGHNVDLGRPEVTAYARINRGRPSVASRNRMCCAPPPTMAHGIDEGWRVQRSWVQQFHSLRRGLHRATACPPAPRLRAEPARPRLPLRAWSSLARMQNRTIRQFTYAHE